MIAINLKELSNSGLASLLTSTETKLFLAYSKEKEAEDELTLLFDEADNRGIDLYALYSNERKF